MSSAGALAKQLGSSMKLTRDGSMPAYRTTHGTEPTLGSRLLEVRY